MRFRTLKKRLKEAKKIIRSDDYSFFKGFLEIDYILTIKGQFVFIDFFYNTISQREYKLKSRRNPDIYKIHNDFSKFSRKEFTKIIYYMKEMYNNA